jgi:asparagine synthase (glutamine-hydrolysing)
MCGITGFIGRGDKTDLQAMIQALTHRGPDAKGCYINESQQIYLGHKRLAVIDLPQGQQPLWNEDGSIGVIFNGAIYNHIELREYLSKKGHIFYTDHADTEVLVHGYEEWGQDLPLHLNGMFAFAIYDKTRQLLFLARDRFGEKPLYYTHNENWFGFASEITALKKHAHFNDKLSNLALQKFFAYGFIPAPYTRYKNTFKLPAGYTLTYALDNKQLQTKKYWKFTLEPDYSLLQRPEENLASELRNLIENSVKNRLMSDVPLGVFLSGGIDSSIILAAATKNNPAEQIQTFTIGFQEPSYNESRFAAQVATHFNSKHRLKMLKINDLKSLAPKILQQCDDLLCDPSVIPTYMVSQFAKEFVTVILSGDGGDELFAGYDPFCALKLATYYKKLIPSALHQFIKKLVDFIPPSTKNMGFNFKLKRTLTGLNYPENLWNPVWLGPLSPDEITRIFNNPYDNEEIYSEAIALWGNTQAGNIYDKTMEFYTRFYLQDGILMKVDRAAMMNSLETRAPFLDNHIVEFVRKLPHQLKYKNGQRKYLLKKAFKDTLPKNILHRRKKGFGIPITKWLKDFPKNIPTNNISYLNSALIQLYWQQHRNNTADHRLFLWALLALVNIT